jgi:MFS family permease
MINPIVVTLGQIRVTRAVERFPMGHRLVVALLLMGMPFLLLIVNSSVVVIAVVIAVFAVGEMVWVPTSLALAARLAPPHARGAYMGAFNASGSVAWAIGPLTALNLLGTHGPAFTWIFFAAMGIVAGSAGAAASALSSIRPRPWERAEPTAQRAPREQTLAGLPAAGSTVRHPD